MFKMDEEIKISEMLEAENINEEDFIPIIQNGINKKIRASKVGTRGGTTVIDNLLSTSTTDALSANQGRVLNNKVENLNQDGVELASTTSTTEETITIDNINNYRFVLLQISTSSTAYTRVLGANLGLVSQFKTSSSSHNWQAMNPENPSTYGGYCGYVNDTQVVMKCNSLSCRLILVRNKIKEGK